ncbi:crossover junction endodeoxyribonuclease RuvC [Candidatus Nomurabacteria bacterium RIFCSPLOWO2_01_FULL_33_24]|uniref:Crossover junction endodeoxyribonuclease RuvC n=1 Tax=Candidatus Nomurabacteria bacterium RIFCSPLOWO2_01_FULL_33_24 TaxID=1801765 RepID=A0A1F6WZU0_9BACT|nr:MAG: crossover junction endodeoxyribonuclease RuvC [Candidatus Nomurabacteria bacterium RIFCSPLOWO2_01_FULL_33_24]
MRILAIDPGFERVGVAILEKKDGKEKLLYSSCFKTSAKILFAKRILLIGNEINRLIKKYKPKELAIETLFFFKNKKTVMVVSEARGVIIYEAQKAKLSIFEYTPLQVKMSLTGYGKADKIQIQTMVKKIISIDKNIKSDDEIDAIAIGLTHFACQKY